MAKVGFLLQPTRNAPNFVAFIVFIICLFFVLSSLYSNFPSDIMKQNVLHVDISGVNQESNNLSKVQSNTPIAVLVIASQRVRAIKRHLEQLKRLRPLDEELFPIVVSQDGDSSEVTDVIKEFVSTTSYSFFIHHKDRPKSIMKRKADLNYFYIAQHYKWALDNVVTKMNYSTVLITEEDLDIANDFFNYFANMHNLLYQDSTIWCISAWNDNGSPDISDSRRVAQLHRTDFFPGLGWMLTSELWKELSPKWPLIYWDDWMRQANVRKNRVCIRPEVSRTLHNMNVAGKGTSGGLFKQNLAAIRLPEEKVDFSLVETKRLKKEEYDLRMGQQIFAAKPIALSDILNDTFREESTSFSVLNSYRFVYKDPREYRKMAKKFGLMYDIRSGMTRTAYCGVVNFLVEGVRVFALHININLTRPFGSYPCSEVYDEKWDLMSKFLDFSEIYCNTRKWTGGCNPNNPAMRNWLSKMKLQGRITMWGDMIPF